MTVQFFSLVFRKQFAMPFYYAVKFGRKPGVYGTWAECQTQIHKYRNARYKKFPTAAAAWKFITGDSCDSQPTKTVNERDHSAEAFVPAADDNSNCVAGHSGLLLNEFQPQRKASSSHGRGQKADVLVSPGTLCEFKSKLKNIKETMGELQQHMTETEGQLKMLETCAKNKKRPASPGQEGHQSESRSITKRKKTTTDSCQNNGPSGPVSVYTDGCCRGNHTTNRRAGIGVYWGPGHPMNVSEPLAGIPTNNRAEIQAACRAVEQALDCGITDLVLHTDSDYVIKCMTQYIHRWKQNGWKSATGKGVLNKEDLQQLNALLRQSVNVTWVHVRGHQGIEGNEEADRLANEGALKQ